MSFANSNNLSIPIITSFANSIQIFQFSGLPVIMCWAKDDPKVAYRLFAQQYIDAGAKIVGPQSGGHANFLEFDDDANEFLLGLSYK